MSNKSRSIMATTAIVTALTLCFKALGFVKQAVVAYYFGTTFETDLYNVAFNFVGSLSSAFIRAITISLVSIYTHCLVQKGRDAASKLLSACLEILLPVVLVVLLLAYMITPQIAGLLGPSYTATESQLLQHYLYICYPFFLFATITLVWTVLMDSNKDFVVSRTESFITSTTTILCCITLYKVQAVTSLVIAQYLSYIIFSTLLLVRGRRYFSFSFQNIKNIPEIRTVLLTALPLFIGNSVSQINKIVDSSVSTGLGHGNASALAYSVVLEDFVCNILINNVVDILYVNFSTYVAEGNHEQLNETMKKNYVFIDDIGRTDENGYTTGGYGWRKMRGSDKKLSMHAYGCAVDINPGYNPRYENGIMQDQGYKQYKDDPTSHPDKALTDNTEIIKIIKKDYGWGWGGNWENMDYMHISFTDE